MQRNTTEVHELHRLILPHFWYSRSKMVIIPTDIRGEIFCKLSKASRFKGDQLIGNVERWFTDTQSIDSHRFNSDGKNESSEQATEYKHMCDEHTT